MNIAKTKKLNMATAISLILVVLAQPSEPAGVGLFDLETQVRYDLTETKDRGKASVGDGRFSTSYNLGLAPQLFSATSVVSDITFNSSENNDANGRQSNRNWRVNLFYRKPKYTFIGRASRTDYESFSGSVPGSSSGRATEYNASLLLREPAYPVINIQFMRNVTGSSFAGDRSGYTATTWLLSGYYDMEPLRFSYDRTQQRYDYTASSGSESVTQRSAVQVNHTLMRGLTLTGELSKYSTSSSLADGRSSTTTDRQLVRLRATPVRTITANIDFSRQSNRQQTRIGPRTNDNSSISWGIRSQVMPGLSVDYSDQRLTQDRAPSTATTGTVARNRSLAMSARLSQDLSFNAGLTHSEYNIGSGESDTRQDSLQMALQAALGPRTDLSVNYGQNKSTVGLGDTYNSKFAGISIRDRTSSEMSLGATYRRTNVRSALNGGDSFSQTSDILDLDMLWLPTYDMSINLRLSYQANNGANVSDLLAPSANLRWQIDSDTNATFSYTMERLEQWDWTLGTIAKRRSKGLSLRLTHAFLDGSSVDVSYDFQGVSVGQREWQKQLRLYYTRRL